MNDEIIPLEDDIYEEEIEVEEETAVMNAMWGNISGNIANQTDLQQALDAKQDNLTQAQLDAVNSGITSAKVATYDGYPAQITSAVSSEADIRRQADTTLQSNIDAEERARKAADKDIQDVVDGETLARQNADNALGGRIDTEIHDRQVADNGLQSQIDAITSKSDVVDVVANYAALQAYDTSTLGNNDVVKVLDDETHGDAMTYYRWSTTTQTWSYIGQEAPYYTKSQTDTLLLDKQDKIDATHKLSADLVDDTSTTNKFVTAQDKTNWNAKQDALTAGNNIDITGTTISTPAIAPEVVAELPATGAEGKLYLTPKNYTRGTGTGNPITATITDGAGKMESFKLDGDTYQQTYTGKNLLNPLTFAKGRLDNGVVGYQDGTSSLEATATDITFTTITNFRGVTSDYIQVVGGSKYTQNQQLSVDNNTGAAIAQYDSSKTFIQQDNLVTGAVITMRATTAYIRIYYFARTAGTITLHEPQLESGSTSTDFEPFVGGQASPNPDYPQPIQTVTGEQTVEIVGKNLFDKTSQISDGYTYSATGSKEVLGNSSIQEAYISVLPNTTYTLHTDATSSQASNFRVFICEYDSGKGFIQRDVPAQTTSNTNTITTTANTYFVRLCFSTVGIDTLQFEKSASPTTYTPYSKQTLPINLGKNLFDKDNAVILTGELNADKTYSTDAGKTIYIKCKPNTTYSVQKADIGNRARLGTSTGYLPNGGTATNYAAMGTVASGKRYGRITTGQNDKFLWFSFARSDDSEEIITRVINSIQIEAGAQYSSYAPYKTPIELCKLDTKQDYIWKDGEDWKVHKETGTVAANAASDKTWIKSGQSTSSVFVAAWTNMRTGGYAHTLDDRLLAQSFAYNNTTTANTGRFNRNVGSTEYDYLLLRFDISVFNTLDKVKTWLNNNPQTVYYSLATPTDTTITDTDLIAQLEAIRTASLENGTNTISNTAVGSNLAGDMEVGYYGYNPTNRYDKWLWLDLNNNYEQIGE